MKHRKTIKQAAQTIPVHKGQTYELHIDRLGTSGEGDGRYDNFTVFVPNALPGETVFVVIEEVKNSYARGRIKQILHHGRETDAVLQIHIEPLKRQCLFIRHIDVIIAQHHAHAIDIELLHRHFAGLRIHKAIIAVSAKRQKEFLHGQIIPLPAEFPIGTEEWLCHIIECVIDIKYYTAYIHNILIPYT